MNKPARCSMFAVCAASATLPLTCARALHTRVHLLINGKCRLYIGAYVQYMYVYNWHANLYTKASILTFFALFRQSVAILDKAFQHQQPVPSTTDPHLPVKQCIHTAAVIPLQWTGCGAEQHPQQQLAAKSASAAGANAAALRRWLPLPLLLPMQTAVPPLRAAADRQPPRRALAEAAAKAPGVATLAPVSRSR